MKKIFVVFFALLVLLLGCRKETGQEPTVQPSETSPTVGAADAQDAEASETVIAKAGTAVLTNGELRAWYWAEVAQWQLDNPECCPDFDRPLALQSCPADSSIPSWEAFFLGKALDRWHTAQSLVMESAVRPLPLDPAYNPDTAGHELYLTDMPATRYLYGYRALYTPNSLHQAYLDSLPEALEVLAKERGYADAAAMAEESFGTNPEALLNCAELLNRGYMYFTQMSYYIEPASGEPEADGSSVSDRTPLANIRHILLVPEETGEVQGWETCQLEAQRLLKTWKNEKRGTEAAFGELANRYSADGGTAKDGGGYRNIRPGQLPEALDAWCFDPARQPGDTTILSTDAGIHILYFSGSRTEGQWQAETAYYREKQQEILETARKAYPMEVEADAIVLSEAQGTVAMGDLLYPDIAHERFPEVPLYLQQDFGDTLYGNYRLAISGCGITSLAMVASYMMDEELTPPELCALFGRYSHASGTDSKLFMNEPAGLGFYLQEVSWSIQRAKEALEEGQVLISLQSPGYWTGGGHYMVIESIHEGDMVQVRDSDLENYHSVPTHREDRHPWRSIVTTAAGFWIFEEKVTRIPACTRCGTGEGIVSDYLCRRCEPAVLRRDSYLKGDCVCCGNCF